MTSPVTIHGPWELGTNLTATGNRVDAASGGGTLTGAGTPTYVAVWSSPTNLGDSTIIDNGVDVTLTAGSLKTPDQAGTYGNGVDLRMTTGAGGSVGGAGGQLILSTGTAPAASYGAGDIQLRPAASYFGGSITGFGGDGTGTSGTPAGTVQFVGGNSIGTAGKGGAVQFTGGASLQGDGGDVIIASGAGSTLSGVGAGGNVTITAEIGATSANNGNLTLVVTKGGSTGGFLIINGLPTSASGLPSGALWLNANVLTRVP
jgi:hypothetical protein